MQYYTIGQIGNFGWEEERGEGVGGRGAGGQFNMLINYWSTCLFFNSTCSANVDQHDEYEAPNQYINQLLINFEVKHMYGCKKLINSWATSLKLVENQQVDQLLMNKFVENKQVDQQLLNVSSEFNLLINSWSTQTHGEGIRFREITFA